MVHMILYIHSDISKIEMKKKKFHKPKNKSKLKKASLFILSIALIYKLNHSFATHI